MIPARQYKYRAKLDLQPGQGGDQETAARGSQNGVTDPGGVIPMFFLNSFLSSVECSRKGSRSEDR